MTLRIDEAAKRATNLQHRLWNGERALKALTWLKQPDLIKHADLRIVSQWGSSNDGNKAALEYLNIELAKAMEKIVTDATRQAQRDMDNYLGRQAEHD
ncbi:hypothetical protein [Sphingobium fuliginis]|jgi:hypothetical protein|uniref:hypothetical protein n=1 Tax=Sphingobium fuliginis (strain ATCC 27551) TaxID=336203 RepID=UPI0037C84A60